jgi:hypothetical protein
LYGESAPSLFEKAAETVKHTKTGTGGPNYGGKSWKKFLQPPKPTFWALALRENGNLQIMSLPDFTVKFLINNFPLGPNVLTDALFTTIPEVCFYCQLFCLHLVSCRECAFVYTI